MILMDITFLYFFSLGQIEVFQVIIFK